MSDGYAARQVDRGIRKKRAQRFLCTRFCLTEWITALTPLLNRDSFSNHPARQGTIERGLKSEVNLNLIIQEGRMNLCEILYPCHVDTRFRPACLDTYNA